MQEDVEPVMQLHAATATVSLCRPTCSARRRVGIRNVLCLTGDHQRFGDHPDAKGVFDMDSTQLAWAARTLRDSKHLMWGCRFRRRRAG